MIFDTERLAAEYTVKVWKSYASLYDIFTFLEEAKQKEYVETGAFGILKYNDIIIEDRFDLYFITFAVDSTNSFMKGDGDGKIIKPIIRWDRIPNTI